MWWYLATIWQIWWLESTTLAYQCFLVICSLMCTLIEVLSIMTKEAVWERALLKLINSALAVLVFVFPFEILCLCFHLEKPVQSVSEFEEAISSARLSFLGWICSQDAALAAVGFAKSKWECFALWGLNSWAKIQDVIPAEWGAAEAARVCSRSSWCWFQIQWSSILLFLIEDTT